MDKSENHGVTIYNVIMFKSVDWNLEHVFCQNDQDLAVWNYGFVFTAFSHIFIAESIYLKCQTQVLWFFLYYCKSFSKNANS